MKFSKIFMLFILMASAAMAQEKQVTLEEIWSGKFRQQQLQNLQSLNNGKEYVVLHKDRTNGRTRIDVYSYKTGKKTSTLVDSDKLSEIKQFDDFSFSSDERKILLATNKTSIYRRSSKAVYYIYDVASGSVTKISDEQIQEPTFSPDNSKVAYVFENNIYTYDVSNGKVNQITTDGKKNQIINGVTDWVYEEELSFVRAFKWNIKGDKIAYLRFDESEVPEFSMDIFGTALYPHEETFKYPKAGEANSKVSLHIYDVSSKTTEEISLGDYKDFYIPRLQWTQKPYVLSVQVLNRKQNKLDLLFVNAKSNKAKVVLTETDKAYIDVTDNLTFLQNNDFIWTSERSGYNHIYLYNEEGKLQNQVTEGDWEVTQYYGYNPNNNRIYYQSTEEGSVNRDVYAVKPNGKSKKRLTQQTGMNSADFSADFTYFINTFTNTQTPYQYTLHLAKNGKLIREIEDNTQLLQVEKAYNFSTKELSTIEINGNSLNMWMVKPSNFDENKEYPLLMFQYSGPGSQSVSNSYYNTNDYWYQLLADKGYIIACVDGRGTGFKGADFKKVTQNELGKYELEDQISAAKKLGDRKYIDSNRIGIWGWSFGGFMASNAILKGNDVFKMAIAVAPVTSWRFYDTIYTERFMGKPQDNASGYDDNSPINHVEKLKGKYLLIHGSGDDNVHVQNTMRMVEALVQANKQFDWAIYPDKNHGIYGGNTRLHLYTKMTNFITENL
ncbi:S9 family peptidase [Zunongwangia sp.]|uniref:S9 family peptidase n=1 Tax=Zunongwangia sp. TaxID=1965325 RepID=UPI003AA7E09E